MLPFIRDLSIHAGDDVDVFKITTDGHPRESIEVLLTLGREASPLDLVLNDADGRRVAATESAPRLFVTDLAAGNYFLTVSGPSPDRYRIHVWGVPPEDGHGALFSDLVPVDLFDPQVFGQGTGQTLGLASHIMNVGTAPAPAADVGDATATFRLIDATTRAVKREGVKGPVFFTDTGGCPGRAMFERWVASGEPLMPGSEGAPDYTRPGCIDLYDARTNEAVVPPMTIGDRAEIPNGDYLYELEVDAPGTFVFEPQNVRSNNRGWIPITVGTAADGVTRTVMLRGSFGRAGFREVSSIASTVVGNGDDLDADVVGPDDVFQNNAGIGRPGGVNFNSRGVMFYTLWDDGSLCQKHPTSSTKVVTGLDRPAGFDFLPNDDVVIAEFGGGGRIVTAVFNGTGYDPPRELILPGFTIASPTAVRVGPDSRIYIVNTAGHEVISVVADGSDPVRVAGTGVPGFDSDDGPVATERLSFPTGVDLTPSGLLVVADAHNNRLRAVNLNRSGSLTLAGRTIPAGRMVTLAGAGPASTGPTLFDNGSRAWAGDGGHGRAVLMDRPASPRIYRDHVYFVDADNHRLRVIDDLGYVHHVAGNAPLPAQNGPRAPGSLGADVGDGGPGVGADINRPMDFHLQPDPSSVVDLYLADTDAHRIRMFVGPAVVGR